MKKILSIFLAFSMLLSLVSCRRSTNAAGADAEAPITLLVIGLDEVAENTDVLLLTSIDVAAHRISMMQIPRDTYCRFDGEENKINALYAARRYAGATEAEALNALSSSVEDIFSLSLAGTVAFKAEALRAAVDALGGVRIEIPSDLSIEGREYKAGEHLLSGAEAEAFVRYRDGYVMGDLGRVDAQKLFLHALLRRAKETLSPAELIRTLFSMRGALVTDLSLSRALSVALFVHSHLSSLSPVFFTLPGEPILHHGHWYYVANRPSTEALLSEYFSTGSVFDPHGQLFDADSLPLSNIYNDPHIFYHVYTEEDLSSLKIQTKRG